MLELDRTINLMITLPEGSSIAARSRPAEADAAEIAGSELTPHSLLFSTGMVDFLRFLAPSTRIWL